MTATKVGKIVLCMESGNSNPFGIYWRTFCF